MRRLAHERVSTALVPFALAASASALLVLGGVSCAASTRTGVEDTPDGPAGSSGGFVPGDGGPVAKPPECADETKDVFVIAEDRSLYSFHPPTLVFKNKGILNCPTDGCRPRRLRVGAS